MYHYHQPIITSGATIPYLTASSLTTIPMVPASYPLTYLVNQPLLTTTATTAGLICDARPLVTSSLAFETKPILTTTAATFETAPTLSLTESKLVTTEIPVYGFMPLSTLRLRPLEITLTSNKEEKKESTTTTTVTEEKKSEDIKVEEEEKKEEKSEEKSENVLVKKEIIYHCHRPTHVLPELTREELDERIRRIRKELNLPDPTVEEELCHHHHAHHKRGDEVETTTKWVSESSQQDMFRRSRSKSAERWYRSRSKSAGRTSGGPRPAWKPTGGNDYTSTYLRRADMIINSEKSKNKTTQESQTCSNDWRPKTALDVATNTNHYKCYYVDRPPRVDTYETGYYTYTQPAKTIIKTTIEGGSSNIGTSKSYQYYADNLPSIINTNSGCCKQQKTVKYAYYEPSTTTSQTTKSYVYKPSTNNGTTTALAPTGEYYCRPIYRTKSYSNLVD